MNGAPRRNQGSNLRAVCVDVVSSNTSALLPTKVLLEPFRSLHIHILRPSHIGVSSDIDSILRIA